MFAVFVVVGGGGRRRALFGLELATSSTSDRSRLDSIKISRGTSVMRVTKSKEEREREKSEHKAEAKGTSTW